MVDGHVLSLMPYYAISLHDFIRHRRRIARLLTTSSTAASNNHEDNDEPIVVTNNTSVAATSSSFSSSTASSSSTSTSVSSPSSVASPVSPVAASNNNDDNGAVWCPLSYGEVRWVGHQICAALDHLQDHSIAHNSISPFNIRDTLFGNNDDAYDDRLYDR